MSLYTVNGTQFEYDEMDLTAIELYNSELARLRAGVPEDFDPATSNDAIAVLREQCEAVMDFFDCVVGEGTSDLIFGTSRNIKTILSAFSDFTTQVTETWARLKAELPGAPAPVSGPVNREQRRAQEREQRRKEAAERAAIRGNAG